MLNTIKTKAVSAKNHISKHRFKYGVATGFAAGLYLMHRSREQLEEFLAEKGIDPMEYYNPEYFAELQAS